jgi:hypothetical protein
MPGSPWVQGGRRSNCRAPKERKTSRLLQCWVLAQPSSPVVFIGFLAPNSYNSDDNRRDLERAVRLRRRSGGRHSLASRSSNGRTLSLDTAYKPGQVYVRTDVGDQTQPYRSTLLDLIIR